MSRLVVKKIVSVLARHEAIPDFEIAASGAAQTGDLPSVDDGHV